MNAYKFLKNAGTKQRGTLLKKEKIYKAFQNILSEKVMLVIGTGTSMALDPDFGMRKLKEELLEKIPYRISSSPNAKNQWDTVKQRLNDGFMLESAMNAITEELLHKSIINITGHLIAKLDQKFKIEISKNRVVLPIKTFLKKLVIGLPESNPVLNIVTPNYDMLLEHCCDKLKIPFCTGFVGGIRKHYDWKNSLKLMQFTKDVTVKSKIRKVVRTKRYVRLHKVHGSLNWFKGDDGIFEDNTMAYEIENEYDRMIIPPGNSKFEKVLLDSRDFLQNADEAINNEKAYIIIGYGFNDIHIEKELKTSLINNEKPGIIITKELSKGAKDIISKSKNLWAVSQDKNNPKNTSILHKSYSAPEIFDNSDIWKIDNFSKEILGE